MYIYTHADIHTHTHINTYMYTYIHTHMHKHLHTHTYTHGHRKVHLQRLPLLSAQLQPRSTRPFPYLRRQKRQVRPLLLRPLPPPLFFPLPPSSPPQIYVPKPNFNLRQGRTQSTPPFPLPKHFPRARLPPLSPPVFHLRGFVGRAPWGVAVSCEVWAGSGRAHFEHAGVDIVPEVRARAHTHTHTHTHSQRSALRWLYMINILWF